jgi:hypothetical protein
MTMIQHRAKTAIAVALLGTAGLSMPATAQNVIYPPGANCMMITGTQRTNCIAQQQQRANTNSTIVAPSGSAGAANAQNPAQNPASANPSALTGPSTTVAPDTSGPSTTVAPNTAGTSTIVTPNSVPNGALAPGASVNSSRTVLPNSNPNAVTTPGGTVSPNSVQMPSTGATSPIIVPNGATTGTTGGVGIGGSNTGTGAGGTPSIGGTGGSGTSGATGN